MKQLMNILLLLLVMGAAHADAVQVQHDADKKKLTVDDGLWRYVFSTQSNLLEYIANSENGLNLLVPSKWGGGHWLYSTGGTERRKYIRQGASKGAASHEIVVNDGSKTTIRFTTQLGSLTIQEDYTFKANSGIVLREYDIVATSGIPDMALFCWQVKLGTSGASKEPFDYFVWGRGPAVLQNENEMKSAGVISGPVIGVSDTRDWASGYWIKPDDLKDRYIAMLNRSRKEYWMLAFEPEGEQPWFFLGDYGNKGHQSEWFGFRVYGETVFSKIMPTYSIPKDTRWTGTVCHVIGTASKIKELNEAYQNWLNGYKNDTDEKVMVSAD